MDLKQSELNAVLRPYTEHFRDSKGNELKLQMQPLNAAQRSALRMMYGGPEDMEALQRAAWSYTIIGWDGMTVVLDNGNKIPLKFSTENLVRVLTLNPELTTAVNNHIAERNSFGQDEEGQSREQITENFTAPPPNDSSKATDPAG